MAEEVKTRLLEEGDHFGDYTVVKLLGKGGMGAVYLMQGTSGSQYAVKIMFPEKVSHEMRRRFAKEAEFAIKIRHRNLVSVYDVGEDPETGLCYMIMDYVSGGTLSDRLKEKGRFSIQEAVPIVSQIAAALDVAHKHGLVHRDIKPDNIMFDADGTPKLSDLGVAKFDDAQQSMVTTTGMVIGTPAYMAPEQMLNSHAIDARADIYSLSVVLYEMLSGKRPNEGRTAIELMAKAIKGEPLPDIKTMCPELSVAVAHVVSLLCAPKPEERPQTALGAADLLRKAASGKFVLVKKKPQSSTAEAAALRARRRKLFKGVAIGVGIAAFLFVGVAGWIKALSRQEPVKAVVVMPTTNVLERVTVVTNVVETTVVSTNAAVLTADAAYVSRSALHAAYRSKERRRVFVEIPLHDDSNGFETPPCTLARLEEAIAAKVDIIWLKVACSRDGVLYVKGDGDLKRMTNAKGHIHDFTADELSKFRVKWRNGLSDWPLAAFEDLLRRGKGKVFFKVGWSSRKVEYTIAMINLLNRLDAWESMILEVDGARVLFKVFGDEMRRKICSGELQIMTHPDQLGEWTGVASECSVWSRSADLEKIGLAGIPQRIETYFGWDPGDGKRTNDEAGWSKAMSDGVTIFRTRTPRELIKFLSSHGAR